MVAVCRQHPLFSTDDWYIVKTPMAAGIPAPVGGLLVEFDYNDLDSLDRLFQQFPRQIAAVILEAETTEPPAPGFFAGLRSRCDADGAVFVLDEIITGFRWHERGAQYVHDIHPHLSTFGKGIANGFPLSALVGSAEIMQLGGFTEDADRVFLLSQTAGAQPWALAAMLAVIDTYEQEHIAERLLRTGAELRKQVQDVVASAGLTDYFQVLGRDCNLVFATLDGDGERSQAFRTLVHAGVHPPRRAGPLLRRLGGA